MQHVQGMVDDIRKLTPELIKAAGDATQSDSVEPLRLVAHEWATKVSLSPLLCHVGWMGRMPLNV